MKSDANTEDNFDEKQSISTIKRAIATSRKTLKDDGFLLIIWGLPLSLVSFWHYYQSIALTTWWVRYILDFGEIALGIAAIGITAYYIFFRKKKVTTYTAISARFVWIGVIIAANLNVIISKAILAEVNFSLLQPLQLVLIGFALFVSGGIYRYYVLLFSGVLMWIAAAISANYLLNVQFLIRAIAVFVCFVIPGILMYSSAKKEENV